MDLRKVLEQEREHLLCHGVGRIGRHIGDRDAALLAGGEVDVVVPGRAFADIAQFRRGGEQVFIDIHFVDEQDVGVGQFALQFLPCRVVEDDEVSDRLEPGHVDVAAGQSAVFRH